MKAQVATASVNCHISFNGNISNYPGTERITELEIIFSPQAMNPLTQFGTQIASYANTRQGMKYAPLKSTLEPATSFSS